MTGWPHKPSCAAWGKRFGSFKPLRSPFVLRHKERFSSKMKPYYSKDGITIYHGEN